jgi:urea ABC transporter ATP-binding protein UrtE
MLKVEAIVAGYLRGSRVLDELSFRLDPGEVVAVLGRNGMGKTTLTRAIAGHLPLTNGRIELAGTRIDGLPPYEIFHLGVGFVPQGRDIFGDFTVEENLLLGLLGMRDAPDTVPDWGWRQFPILAERRQQKAGTLSGGQQQQLAIMRALVSRPRLLVLDEPSEGIQPSIVQEIGRALRAFAEREGLTILLVEQNLGLVLAVASRCLFLENGRIMEDAPVGALRQDRQLLQRYLSV